MARRRALLCGAVTMLALSACSSDPAPASAVTLSVAPARALFDTALTITVRGLAPHAHVTLSASSVAADEVTWSASAVFAASADGRVDSAQAPVSGSYHGANAMGLVETLAPNGDPDDAADFVAPTGAWQITLTARVAGTIVATKTVQRLSPSQAGVSSRQLRPATDGGLYGEYDTPAAVAGSRPAVIVIGGAEGGLAGLPAAEALAARGYPALALAYFAEPGLPATLSRIPLEYFARALAWLARQPGVDAHRVVIWGMSRGSEAALLTAADFPSQAGGVIAGSPSDIAYAASGGPAWTLNGHPVPYTAGDLDAPPGPHAAYIPLAPIRGPVFAVCGSADRFWRACDHLASIGRRLAGAAHPPTLLRYTGAGHFVATGVPYTPSTAQGGDDATGQRFSAGGTPAADGAARADAWGKLLAWLHDLPVT